MARKKLVAGNWNMHTTLIGAKALAEGVVKGAVEYPETLIALCPPFPWLTAVGEIIRGSHVGLGAQNCHYEKEGAFTGEVSPTMLIDAGCHYVIVGHSERRHGLGETDELLNKKATAAIIAGLRVIFCIGELLAEREAGQTEAVLDRQLTLGLADIPAASMARVIIAYEPVWAIGGPKPATPDQAQAAHAFIRQKIAAMYDDNVAKSLLILYGGAVKPDNAAGLLHLADVDGALVGGASLKPDSFLPIISAASSGP
jgi:triosephosphate isomerase